MRPFAKLTITEKAEKSIRAGHTWVYGEEVTHAEGDYQNGEVVDVYSKKDRYLGSGFVSETSKIRVRLLSRNANDRYGEDFFRRRVEYALAYRKTVMGEDYACCRLIFGEADGFPGLTVDRFGDVLVTEVLSFGMDSVKDWIYTALLDCLRKEGETVSVIYERNDSPLRQKEGLPLYSDFYKAEGLLTEDSGERIICENGIRYHINYKNGQKTGFFLDQKYNRLSAAKIAKGKRVLDCCTHLGSFALNCAKAGAEHVTAVDISADAIAMTEQNAILNGLEGKMDFLCVDVFDLLTKMDEEKNCPYDFIILDPPAFTKNRATVDAAYRGYKEINRKAMKLLPRGGYLATCSCSHHMTEGLFRKMLSEAAADASVSLRQIEARQQCADHPILWGVPETHYLKFYLFQVI